jgi:lycopene cyclase domain-containing protein
VTYTALCIAGVLFAVLLDLAILRTRLLRRRVFWLAYAIILFFQILTNGWLTGRQIVQYSGEATLGSGAVQFLGDGRLGRANIKLVGILGTTGRAPNFAALPWACGEELVAAAVVL